MIHRAIRQLHHPPPVLLHRRHELLRHRQPRPVHEQHPRLRDPRAGQRRVQAGPVLRAHAWGQAELKLLPGPHAGVDPAHAGGGVLGGGHGPEDLGGVVHDLPGFVGLDGGVLVEVDHGADLGIQPHLQVIADLQRSVPLHHLGVLVRHHVPEDGAKVMPNQQCLLRPVRGPEVLRQHPAHPGHDLVEENVLGLQGIQKIRQLHCHAPVVRAHGDHLVDPFGGGVGPAVDEDQ
mmetsp:Transcript_90799/g.243180  ORF Transcript_90799/g.243180 Transcript_90799/m.243180 type:complete len:233 (-) Transcript_90799:774-1472(-)